MAVPCAGGPAQQLHSLTCTCPDAVQAAICARLSLNELARLASVSKVWAAEVKSRLAAEQQRLRAVAAEAPLFLNSAGPHQPLQDVIPTTLPPVLSPSIAGIVPRILVPGHADTWHQGGWNVLRYHAVRQGVRSQRYICMHGFIYGSCSIWRSLCFSGEARRQFEHVSVAVAVGWVEELPPVQGLLLHLLQDMLPGLLEQPSKGQCDHEGPAHPLTTVHIKCTLSFQSEGSMWAPLCPLLRKLQVIHVNPGGQIFADAIRKRNSLYEDAASRHFFDALTESFVGQKRVVFKRAGPPKSFAQGHLDAVLTVQAPSWGV